MLTAAAIFAALLTGHSLAGRHVLISGHPDDETISCAALLSCVPDMTIVQLTTGADEGSSQVAARRAERTAALLGGEWSPAVIECSVDGGRAYQRLADLARAVRSVQADVVWAHPYEGGHLDHDSAAWLSQTVGGAALRMEFASYHATARAQTFGAFWPDPTVDEIVVQLAGDRLSRKQAAVSAYVSQAAILRKFPAIEREPYRVAPIYDFGKPAAPPRCRWDVKGYRPSAAEWRATVAEASRRLQEAA